MKPIRIPTHFMGKPIKGAMKRLEEAEKEKQEKPSSAPSAPIQTKTNINKLDYLQIPNTKIIISKFELSGYNNLSYEQTHFKLLGNGLSMPSPAIFLPHFKNVIQAYIGNTILYDASGNPINTKETKDIYKHLTINHIAAYQGQERGVWSWLNAKFKKQNSWQIEIVTGLDSNKQLITKTSPLEQCLMENCFVELEFNSQGLPTRKSRNQEYIQGQNIYYWHPEDECVAGFGAYSDRADLYCNGYPWNSNASLGVFACAEGAHARNRS